MQRRFRKSVAATTTALLMALAATSASAATINVTTTTDEIQNPGTGCGLREAINSANVNGSIGGCPAGAGDDTVAVPAGTYALTIPGTGEDAGATGDLDMAGAANLSIVGSGKVVIDAGGIDRALHHAGPAGTTLRVDGVSIRGGANAGSDGGGILNQAATVQLENVTITGNSTAFSGGGIANYATANLSNVTITGNQTEQNGGGIYAPGTATTTIRNTTIAGNAADTNADDNGDGGGFHAPMGNFNSYNSIIANNSDSSPTPANQSPDCSSGPSFFPRFTLIENFPATGCLIGFEPGTNIYGQDPNLGALADNGGPVLTLALQTGSIAIDKGGTTGTDTCVATDARGIARPQFAGCDLGAFELAPPGVNPPVVTPGKCAGKTATQTGTAKRDVIKGTAKRDIIAALGGNDKISGLGGNDLICGGKGKDALSGGKGRDDLRGEAGNDKLTGGAGKDVLRGAKGKDKLFGGPAKDKLAGGPGKDTQKQ